MTDNKSSNKFQSYTCDECNYNTVRKSQYERHLLTAKHKLLTNTYEKVPKSSQKVLNKKHSFICNCGKEYFHRQSLYNHKRKCTYLNDFKNEIVEESDNNNTINNNTDMIMVLIKQNSEFKEMLFEQSKQIVEQQKENHTLQKQLIDVVKEGKTINNMTNSNNNNQFNLNFFLNNTCKDAMNLSEFIDDMNVNFNDIEYIGRNGYVNGMTNMILSRIRDLDVTKRPIHCTDLKRETMYIKDNNEWNKDTADKSHFRNMVKIVAKHNQYQFPIWREKHPASDDMNSETFEFSLKMIQNILGDVGEDHIKLDNKVMRNLSKHILVDKN